MELFKTLAPMVESGSVTVTLTIGKTVPGKLGVTFLPIIRKTKDEKEVKDDTPAPLTISGTPAELDEGFIDVLQKAAGKVEGLVTSIKSFERAVEESKLAVMKDGETAKKKTAKLKAKNDGSAKPEPKANQGELFS